MRVHRDRLAPRRSNARIINFFFIVPRYRGIVNRYGKNV